MEHEPVSINFRNPRQTAEFDDWPIGGTKRGKCKFWVECSPGRGYRVGRQTTDKTGKWCKPKFTTYTGRCCIVDGDDGKTYVLRIVAQYSFVDICRSDFMQAQSPVFSDHPQYGDLVSLVNAAYPEETPA